MTSTAHNSANLVGEKHNQLLVISLAGTDKHQKRQWNCVCDCGKETVVGTTQLRRGNTRSCGCLKTKMLMERKKPHGMVGSKTYRIWQGMLNRCRNENQPNFKNYGGRGILVCKEWEFSFENFYEDMGECPGKGYSIDRIDNEGNYCVENCRWITLAQQSRNRRNNRNITFNGETMLLCEWANRLSIDQASLRERLEKWPLEKALTKPKRVRK